VFLEHSRQAVRTGCRLAEATCCNIIFLMLFDAAKSVYRGLHVQPQRHPPGILYGLSPDRHCVPT
jgi:hypothetical protein